MSGAEAIAVIGLISSVISIIQTSRDLYDTANSARGLPAAFRTVSSNVPLILQILRQCKQAQEEADREYQNTTDIKRKQELQQSADAVKPIMVYCQGNAEKLQAIFEKVVPGEQAGAMERYRKAAQAIMPDKKRKVEDLMKGILEQLQLLQTHQFYKSILEDKAENVAAGIEELEQVEDSLPEQDGRFSHSGSGSMNINSGSGSQTNQSITGGSDNRMYNATTQNFND